MSRSSMDGINPGEDIEKHRQVLERSGDFGEITARYLS